MRHTTVFCRLIALALLFAAAQPAAAQWKWRDAAGRTQYSDRPPPAGTPEADILQRPQALRRTAAAPAAAASAASAAAAPAPGTPPAPKPGEPALEAKRRQAEQEEAARKKADEDRLAAARADNCSRARGQLRALDDGVRIARVNENGEREILDDQARAAEAERVRAIVASDCR